MACSWCENPEELVGHALQRCGGCKTLSYCGKICQQADWKHHKEECRAIKAGEAITPTRRVTVRVNGVGMLRREGEPIPPPDPDTVYYTKTSLPHFFDVSIAGPFYPIEKMGQLIESRCSKEKSLPALRTLKEVTESIGLVSLQQIVAPLPGGAHMTIEVVREKNPSVAEFLRSCPPGIPRPVFMVIKQVPHPAMKEIMAGGWPFNHIPHLDLDILKSCLSKETANEEAGKILESWKADSQPEDKVIGGVLEGDFIGKLCGPDLLAKQVLMVHMNDGEGR
jgi:hypothetical protein